MKSSKSDFANVYCFYKYLLILKYLLNMQMFVGFRSVCTCNQVLVDFALRVCIWNQVDLILQILI